MKGFPGSKLVLLIPLAVVGMIVISRVAVDRGGSAGWTVSMVETDGSKYCVMSRELTYHGEEGRHPASAMITIVDGGNVVIMIRDDSWPGKDGWGFLEEPNFITGKRAEAHVVVDGQAGRVEWALPIYSADHSISLRVPSQDFLPRILEATDAFVSFEDPFPANLIDLPLGGAAEAIKSLQDCQKELLK